jgi:HD superfamily phosphodiesterase
MPAISNTTPTKEQIEHVKKFVNESTKHFDASHNGEHAEAVWNNVLAILKIHDEMNLTPGSYSEHKFPDYDLLQLMLVAWLHDVCDHKYPESISQTALYDYVRQQYGDEMATNVKLYIDHISFSKQDKAIKNNEEDVQLSYHGRYLLDVLRDADRIEAIGKVGLERCETFARSRHPNASDKEIRDLVLMHCYEKLLRLLNEHFICTYGGRILAAPHHRIIVDYVKQYPEFRELHKNLRS